jgi:two-component system chemotaxis response regulator CheB
MSRPGIDILFRSAAAAYGLRVIEVILSGLLNDGASGLEALKRCGSVAIVQDPADEMPTSALGATNIDPSASGARIGDVLSELVSELAEPSVPIPGYPPGGRHRSR